jgi:hypothetical protein
MRARRDRFGPGRRWWWALALLGVVVTAAPASVPAAPRFGEATRATPTLAAEATENWAGYVTATGPTIALVNRMDGVHGRWTVPVVDCTGVPDTVLGVWVGIDGLVSPTVEQVGTATECRQGRATSYAWSEIYPGPPLTIGQSVRPGDVIDAAVTSVGEAQFALSVEDTTAGWQFSERRQAVGRRDSAEWIVEAPVINGTLTALANFGTVAFTDASVTIDGHDRPVGGTGQWTSSLHMVAPNGRGRAVASAPDDTGTRFSVLWQGQ